MPRAEHAMPGRPEKQGLDWSTGISSAQAGGSDIRIARPQKVRLVASRPHANAGVFLTYLG
jgi:uncharacterized RmlC-like cupin family protein